MTAEPPTGNIVELLGKHLGMFVNRHEVGKPGAFDGLTREKKLDKARAIARRVGLGWADEPAVGSA